MHDTNALSDREIEILQLVATGLTNREIAQELTISPNTVKVHIRNIFEKINVSSRTEATLYGIEHGIVNVPGMEAEEIQYSLIDVIRKYLWAFIALTFLVVVSLISLGGNLLFSSQLPTPETEATVPERWQQLESMKVARSGLAVVAYDNAIYTIAGETESGPTGLVEMYNPQTDIWIQLSDKPIPVTYISAAVLGEKIYIPGGELATGSPTDVFEVYDPRKDEWDRKASLPVKVSGYALVTFEGQMYLFGGWNGERVLDVVLRYDPEEDIWEEITPMPTARAYAGAVEAGGKIYVIGGWDGNKALAVNERFAPAREGEVETVWEDQSEMPEKGYGMGVVRVADMIYIIGGNYSGEDVVGRFLYSIVDNSWEIMDFGTNENLSVENSGYCFLDGLIYIIGGKVDQTLLARNISYKAIYTVLLPITTNQ